MINLNFKQLRYFEALARFGHFGRAADSCAISQPALSLQIKDLEAMLGSALFERGPRQVTLTSFGEEFARRAREILHAVDELGDFARASRERLVGRLRLGIIPTVAPYLLPAMLTQISTSYPDLDLQIRETLTPKLIDGLSEGRLDAAIVAIPVSEPAFAETPLMTESFVLIRPRKDAAKPAPSAEHLREMRLLLLEEGHCFRDQALSFCAMHSAAPRELLDASSLSTLVQLVDSGLGVTLLPDMAVPVETRSAAVSVTRFQGAEPTRTIGMVWRKTNPLTAQLNEIAALIRSAALTLPIRHVAS